MRIKPRHGCKKVALASEISKTEDYIMKITVCSVLLWFLALLVTSGRTPVVFDDSKFIASKRYRTLAATKPWRGVTYALDFVSLAVMGTEVLLKLKCLNLGFFENIGWRVGTAEKNTHQCTGTRPSLHRSYRIAKRARRVQPDKQIQKYAFSVWPHCGKTSKPLNIWQMKELSSCILNHWMEAQATQFLEAQATPHRNP